MMYNRLFLAIAAATSLALAADSPDAAKSAGSAELRVLTSRTPMSLPPVMRKLEPQDNVVVQLPGPVPVAVAHREVPAPRRPIIEFHEIATHRQSAPPLLPVAPMLPSTPVKTETPAILQPPKKAYPLDLERDTAFFCQKRIGEWTESEARKVLGEPLRDRASFDDDQTESGRIYAFPDPTNRYRELELDFAKGSGRLRTVFVYPWKMTWLECRRIWGTNVHATEANKGRKFYSYVNRRLDVLVDPVGKVISLGLY